MGSWGHGNVQLPLMLLPLMLQLQGLLRTLSLIDQF